MAATRTTTANLSLQGGETKRTHASLWRALSAAAVAATVLSASLGAAASLGSAAAAAPRLPASGVHGEVHLAIWSVDSDGPDFQAVLSGAIGDYGPAVTVLPDGKVDPEHTSEMELKLQHGKFHLYIDAIASKFRPNGPRASLPGDVLGLRQGDRYCAGRGGVGNGRLPRDPRELLLDAHWLRGREDSTVRGWVPCADHRADGLGDGLVLRPG